MQLAAHEAYDLHELAVSCVNSITNMALFINEAQDPELKSLIQEHFPLHIKDYNIKVEYLSKCEGTEAMLPIPDISIYLEDYIKSPANSYIPVKPRVNVRHMNDREIATAYLLTLKRAGREYAWAAMEAANPDIRSFLEDAFMMSSHHAYDVWQWMVKKGYYPLEPADKTTLKILGSMYRTVDETINQD